MFKRGCLYRHRNCLDIDLYINFAKKFTDTHYTLSVSYWNRHYKMFQGEAETVHVAVDQLHNWELV